FTKDVLVPVSTPLVVAMIGVVFTLQSEDQQKADQQTAVMREVMVSQDRHDTAFLVAIDTQLAAHLRRLQADKPITDLYTNFDEQAVFFFYGLHRSQIVNVWAAKGNLTFPRLWIADAFQMVADSLVENILGTEETDPRLDPKAEAVMYKYFGATAADSSGTKTTPLLIDFSALLDGKADARLTKEETEVLVNEFHLFQDRLHKKQIDQDELITDLFAADGLVEYSHTSIFADWYKMPEYAADKIPAKPPLPSDPPEGFMDAFKFYRNEGTNAWNRILIFVSPQSINPHK